MTTSSKTSNDMIIVIVTSATACRAQTNRLTTSIHIAGAQVEEGTFATSYIPTTAFALTRGGDFSSMTGPNFSSWYNPIQGTFGVEFQTLYAMNDTYRFILTGDGGAPLQLLYMSANNGIIASFDG